MSDARVDYLERVPSWVSQGIEHVLHIEWQLPTAIPGWWDGPGFIQVPASRPDVLERHPNARPFCRVAVANIALAGQVVAPMHRSFDPHRADWRDAEGRSVRTDLSGYFILGRGVLNKPEFIEYGGDDDLKDVIEAAGRLSKESAIRTQLREAVGVEERAFAYWLSGKRKPGRETFNLLTSAVAKAARSQLRQHDAFGHLPESELDVIAAFLDLPEPVIRCLYCGRALSGRASRWCPGDVCRKRASRTEQTRFDRLEP